MVTQYSYSGYSVSPNLSSIGSVRLVPGSQVSLPVRYGSPGSILVYVAEQFDKRVENIDQAFGHPIDDGGWNYRNVGGSNSWSNHASATAIDLNWNRHPRGAKGTFTAAQVRAIRQILAECFGAIYWGGDYRNPSIVDEMHFEINANQVMCDKVWRAIQARQNQPAPKKGEVEMDHFSVPAGYAYDESGDNIIDSSLIGGLPFEWTDSSSSIPSFGGGVIVFGPKHYTSPRVKLRVELVRPGADGNDWYQRVSDVLVGGGLKRTWLNLPKGCYGVSVGRIKGPESDGEVPVDVELVFGTK